MNIIIAGDGKMGSTLAKQLASEGYDLTIIDSDRDTLDSSLERYDAMVVHGNCAAMSILKQAGVENADLLIAVTGEDEVNLLCCSIAHGINSSLHTIARVRNPEYTDQIFEFRKLFGLSMAENPEKQTATEIARLLKYPGFLRRDTFAKGKAEIVELRIDKESKLCDIPLSQMNLTVKCRVLVCAVLRDGNAIAPGGNFVLKEGDRIFVTAPAENLTLLLKNLGIISKRVRNPIIIGGGKTSFYLASALEKDGIVPTLIEHDEDRCKDLSSKLEKTSVILGDGTDRDFLESEGLSKCDALITLTDSDELNMVISLFGKSCNVPNVITRLDRIENQNIISKLDLGSIISPKELSCNNIVRYVRAMQNQSGAAISVHIIADGQAEAVEFLVDDDTMNKGVPLKEVKTKEGVLVASITRGSKTEIPGGSSTFREGDIVVIVSSGRGNIRQFNDIFE
ncbi:MAG: Trk system potassium transporter TrkA [Ruminococcaceae bacterium]|nr:Trk system potassium transporter TrkA [Oscillospiraceae bacterium]